MNLYEHDQRETTRRAAAIEREQHDSGWEGARRAVEAGNLHNVGPGAVMHLQRLAGNAGVASLAEEESAAQRSPVLDVVGKGGGSPLPAPVRQEMETGLGADFGDVRIHSDSTAAKSAQAVQAQAYTVGNDVVFNAGAYDPESAAGRHTLAHELTHVVQQRSGPVDGTATGDGVALSDPHDRFEQEAERAAASYDRGAAAPAATSATATATGVQA